MLEINSKGETTPIQTVLKLDVIMQEEEDDL